MARGSGQGKQREMPCEHQFLNAPYSDKVEGFGRSGYGTKKAPQNMSLHSTYRRETSHATLMRIVQLGRKDERQAS